MDLTSLQTALSSLSPTAQMLIVGAIILGVTLWKRYKASASPSTVPTPSPNVATMPASLAGAAPLFHDALVALKLIPPKGATVNDVSHSVLVQFANDIGAVADAHDAIHGQARVDLQQALGSAALPAAPPAPAVSLPTPAVAVPAK